MSKKLSDEFAITDFISKRDGNTVITLLISNLENKSTMAKIYPE